MQPSSNCASCATISRNSSPAPCNRALAAHLRQVFSRSGRMIVTRATFLYLDFIAPGHPWRKASSSCHFSTCITIRHLERDLGSCRNPRQPDSARRAWCSQGLFRTRHPKSLADGHCLWLSLRRVKLNWSPPALLNVLIVVVLAATLFGTVFASSSRAS